MTRARTSVSDLLAQAVDGIDAALESVGIEADVHPAEPAKTTDSQPVDAVLDVSVDDQVFRMAVETMAYCTGQHAASLVARWGPPGDVVPLLVADKITADARNILNDAGWSWLDRRGRLHLRARGVRVDVDVPASDRATGSTAGPPVSGRSGITIAYWLCAHPGHSLSPNASSALLRLAPSTISTTVRRLSDAGLVDEAGVAVLPELFWELAVAWRADRTWVLRAPDPEQHVPPDSSAPSWRMTGTAAAAAYGAPLAATGEGPLELYVTGPVELSIATRRYGAAAPGTGAAVLAVPPTSLVTERHGDGDDVPPRIGGWPAAPMVAVALDLAQDRSRGREILEEWSAGHAIWL